MVRWLMVLLTFAAIGAVVLGGCGLSQEQLDRISKLAQENNELYQAQEKLVADAKAGNIDPVKIAESLAKITAQVKKNIDEIQKIRQEGNSTAAIIGAVLGMFGRSALHGLAGVIPGGGAVTGILQSGLQLLLGGSATAAKKEDED